MCGVIKHKQFERLEDNTQFIALNKVAYRSKIFNKEVFEFAEKIRMTRNRIHLAGLKEIDDFYQKKDIDETFVIAKKVLDRIEIYLKSLK